MSANAGNSAKTKDKNQNIQVAVRCRPVNSIERKQGSCSILQCDRGKREVVVKERPGINPYTKTYNFDHVFGVDSEQLEIYKAVVKPVVEEVLSGYNCTIFAYGQTGTGKTFTMEGERSTDKSLTWDKDPLCGIIPRALHQIFDDLEKQPDIEFSVRVSFLELYNEDLFDLLGSSIDPLRLRIYEDHSKKGSVIISGLEEVVVRTKDEVFEILQRGTAKRQTAATLMNAVSSRSHSVFSVTIHIKENTIDGEELLKTGKLYLVDLAGSENIGRSGAIDKRAREAGNINQSLLTLGRVITSLVEKAPHVPYRESKLTRLLQDSLGGRTKTSIIATISPASINLEETLSTLDYAFRAKNITNRPEINQKMTKKALLREYNEEIERLRRDLQASREKNGIYVAEENYRSMETTIQVQADNIQELEERISTMTTELKNLTEMFTDTKEQLEETSTKLTTTTENLISTTETLQVTKEELSVTRQDRDEKQYFVEVHEVNEEALYSEATQLLDTAYTTVAHVDGLHDKVDRKKNVEEHNLNASQALGQSIRQQIKSLQESLIDLQNKTGEMKQTAEQQLSQISLHHQHEMTTITDNFASFMRVIEEQITEQTKHQQKADKINTGWAVSLEEKLKAMQQSATAASKETQQKYSQLISKAQNDYKKQSVNMEQLVTMLGLKKEQNVTALSTCQSQLVSHLCEMVQQRDTYIVQLKERNAKMCKILEHYAKQDEELEMEITALRAQRKKQQEELLNCTRAHYAEEIDLGDAHSAELKMTEKGMHEMIDIHIDGLKQQVNNYTTLAVNDVKSTIEVFQDVDSLCTNLAIRLEDTQKQTSQSCEEVVQHLSQSMKQRGAQQDSLSKTKQEMLKTFSDSVSVLNVKSEKDIDCNSTTFQQLTEDLASTSNSMNITLSEGISQQFEGQDATLRTVVDFLEKEIKHDKPTGLTPQRSDYIFPTNLTKTEPKETLLERFKAIKELEPEPASPDFDTENKTTSFGDLRGSTNNLSDAGSDKSTHSQASTSGISMCSSRSKVSELDGQENKPQKMKPPKTYGVRKTKPSAKTPSKITKPASRSQTDITLKSPKTKLPLRSNNQN